MTLGSPLSSSLIDGLRRHAARAPDRAAIAAPGLAIGYRELVDRVDATARAFAAQGVGAGEIAGVTVRDEALHLVATLALIALGVPQVSLGSHDPAPMRMRLAGRIGVTRVVAASDDDRLDGLAFARADRYAAPPQARSLPFHGGDGAPAVYLTGSGTTGVPKIVAFSEAQLAVQADRGYVAYAAERVLRLASVEHNNSKRLRLYCLWHGGTCVLRGPEPIDVAALCERLSVTWLDVATYHLEDFVRGAPPVRLPAHTRVRCGGSRVPSRLRRAVLERVTERLHVSYGTTEVGGVCLAYPHEHADPRESVGHPLRGVEVEIVDAERRAVADGEAGEIRMRAPGMATGYVGDARATQRHFQDGWFYPGDLAQRLGDGALCIGGRTDDMMILNGINIFPAEVERVLESMPGVRHAACFALKSDVHGEIPVAVVEVGAEGPDVDAITRWVRGQLGVRAPRRVVVVDALPRNAVGKVARRDLATLMASDVPKGA